MRSLGCLPYSPNDFDVLQLSLVAEGVVYAIPMRRVEADGTVASTLGSLLGKPDGYINTRAYAAHRYDLRDPASAAAFVHACEEAACVPSIHTVEP